jgi:hypothetical protein
VVTCITHTTATAEARTLPADHLFDGLACSRILGYRSQ